MTWEDLSEDGVYPGAAVLQILRDGKERETLGVGTHTVEPSSTGRSRERVQFVSPLGATAASLRPLWGSIVGNPDEDQVLAAMQILWIMPDNGTRGALEDFLVDLVPPGDIHWGPACESVAAARRRGVLFPDQHHSKAQIHTWLAWQKEPGVSFGRAVKSAYFLHDTHIARAFVAWFRRLFPGEAEATAKEEKLT